MYEIYKIITPDNRVYYGQHNKTPDNSYYGSGTIIVRSLRKYGKKAHKKEVLFTCETRDEADYLEKKVIKEAIDNNEPIINIESGGQGCKHYEHKEETKKVLSDKVKELWKNDDYRAKILEARMKAGYHHSDETKTKMSLTRKGRKMPEWFSEYISQRNKNKKLSDETKTKLRYANLGKKLSDETKKRISESNKGKHKVVGEHKKKLINSNIGKKHSIETRRKQSESKKGRMWFTNGELDVLSYKCPEGYRKGRSNYPSVRGCENDK